MEYMGQALSLMISILYKMIKRHTEISLMNRGIEITSTKLNNAIRNWYWGAGFRDMKILNNKCIVYLDRPNKFIGNHNFLKEVQNEFKKNGFEFELVKADPDPFYIEFFKNEVVDDSI